jgi:hypothetical protein
MLLRQDDRGVLAIGQPSHAWVSGQLARAWGNEQFGAVEPYEEVCLGAEQHDIGMAAWDLAPTFNPATGLPHSFIEMPIGTHLKLWSEGPRRLLAQSRYAALLTSMHGLRLYEMRDLSKLAPDDADRVRQFMGDQHAFQEQLVTSLQTNPHEIKRNSDLLWAWDFLSLAVCLDWAPTTAHSVPAAAGPIDVALEPAERPHTLTVDPWPFSAPTITLRCEGRRLTGPYESAAELQAALANGRWEDANFELRKA